MPSADAEAHRYDRLQAGADDKQKDPRVRWRSPAQRDHDRLLYSSAFVRLGGITQVTASEVGRPFHTRLTHTLKVAQVARRSAERLQQKLDKNHFAGSAKKLVELLVPDAAESAALAHDLGHPPFGHLAEEVLRDKAETAGGFEGNAQSFRIAVRLALRSAQPGLDLTRVTLNGMLKYPYGRKVEGEPKKWQKYGYYESDEEAFDAVREYSSGEEKSLEACLMDWADDITYAVHDVDDFSRAGLIPLERLAVDTGELKRFEKRLEELGLLKDDGPGVNHLHAALKHVDLAGDYEGRPTQRVALRSFGSMLITRYIEALTVEPIDDDRVAVIIDEDARLQVEALKLLTRVYVIGRPSLAVIQRGQSQLIDELWERYWEATDKEGDHRILPPAFRDRLAEIENDRQRIRLVTDVVASLDEATALELYRRMSGFSAGSVLDAAAHGT